MAAQLLKGTAYITGAASGIGKATAYSLARHGIQNLTITDISPSSLSSTASELQSAFPHLSIHSVVVDVGDAKAVDDSVSQTVDKFGRIDVGVNVAGIGGVGLATHELEEKDWGKVVDINLNGVWRAMRAQVRVMLEQENLGVRTGRGAIINVASMYGIVGCPKSVKASPYAASKHAVIGLTKSDALQYASQGIRINAISPGYVRTPLVLEALAKGYMDNEVEKTPMGRMAEAEEIGDSIVYLASPLASFMCGGVLVVDGGYTAN
ncbi:oxidoreductase [Amylocarpus encephaloides]|uniref:Oxidoreductase n=1 Tax=Amylocarpus encephaloides TaxID=45428 RepID=A0A9P7YJB7_9HELO|nr:oxidoreductase [Amylocarpus encephaloides]